jgi:hypothetical protein
MKDANRLFIEALQELIRRYVSQQLSALGIDTI